jgi:hypothetical protein
MLRGPFETSVKSTQWIVWYLARAAKLRNSTRRIHWGEVPDREFSFGRLPDLAEERIGVPEGQGATSPSGHVLQFSGWPGNTFASLSLQSSPVSTGTLFVD